MRRTITAIVILVLSTFVGVFSYIFIKDACSQVLLGIDEIISTALTEDVERVNHLCVQTNANWNKKVFLLNILIGREYTQEVSKYLDKLEYFSQHADYASIIANAQDCKAEIQHIIRSNEPELSTIL